MMADVLETMAVLGIIESLVFYFPSTIGKCLIEFASKTGISATMSNRGGE
jgi:hypothetical protein